MLMMKLAVLGVAAMMSVATNRVAKATGEEYTTTGRYYTCGEVITDDGNIWEYSQDTISEAPAYDNEPVYVVFNDMSTPDYIYDDEVVGVVRDTMTAIMDDLEAVLSDDFAVERDGNNMTIGLKEE